MRLPVPVFHASAAFWTSPCESHFPEPSSCLSVVPTPHSDRSLHCLKYNNLSRNFSIPSPYFRPSVHFSGSWKPYSHNGQPSSLQAASADPRPLQKGPLHPLYRQALPFWNIYQNFFQYGNVSLRLQISMFRNNNSDCPTVHRC